MRGTLLGACLALVLAPALWALDDKDKPKPDKTSPAEELKALQAKVQEIQKKHITAYRSAKTDEEKQKIIQDYRKAPQAFAKRALELAQKNAKDQVGHDAAVWMFRSGIKGPEADKAADILIAHHLDKLGKLGQSLAATGNPSAEKLLRALVAKAKPGEAQAQARLNLASFFKNRAQAAEQANEPGVEKYNAQAETIYEEIVKKHADVASVIDKAKSALFELRHLTVGKEAPDIVAEDLDGKKFKLSDYRGKVVLLDFWGHW